VDGDHDHFKFFVEFGHHFCTWVLPSDSESLSSFLKAKCSLTEHWIHFIDFLGSERAQVTHYNLSDLVLLGTGSLAMFELLSTGYAMVFSQGKYWLGWRHLSSRIQFSQIGSDGFDTKL
jgi:hypothetical protein